MFNALFEYAKSLNAEMVQVYWILLPALVTLLVIFELLKSSPNVNDILKRTVISILLILSLATVVNTIGMLSDQITARIDHTHSLWQAIKHLGPDSNGESGSLFDLRASIIYVFSIIAYLIAYIGFFASITLMNFVWAILYICAPIMILCYVPKATARITSNLYRGLVSAATWRILWTLLGALLLKLAMNPKVVGVDDYILSMVMNLMIGISMLVIPLFAKSLLGDGLQSAAAGLAAAPGLMAARAAMVSSKVMSKKAVGGTLAASSFAAKPITNPISGRAQIMASRMKPKVQSFTNWYSQVGLPNEAKKQINKNARRRD